MRVLITGASGCLGQALIADLCNFGHEVVALVRQGRSLPPRQGLEPLEIDLTAPIDPQSLPGRCDAVIHAA